MKPASTLRLRDTAKTGNLCGGDRRDEGDDNDDDTPSYPLVFVRYKRVRGERALRWDATIEISYPGAGST